MSQTADAATTTERRSGWRGRLGARARAVRHRWQKDWSAQPLEHLQTREHWRRVRTWGALALALALMALLIHRLLFAPQRVPLIAMVATDAAWPLAPNSWASEDVALMRQALDGQNVQLADISESWRTREAGMRRLDQQLRELAGEVRRTGVLILYVSIPGAVDESGRPCLIPPGASPLDSGAWLPVAELLAVDAWQSLPHECRKLVIFDSSRQDVDWKSGTIENTFATALESVVRESSKLPNLVIINSNGLGQRGWASPELQGSVFGHFLALGLAGEADATAGNEDREVSLHELTGYLEREVAAWSLYHRGALQRPVLLPSSAADFRVTWSARPSWRRRLTERTPTAKSPAVTDAELAKLWSARERLRNLGLVSLDAAAWHGVEHDLLDLEALTQAGATYAETARNLAGQLQTGMRSLEERLADPAPWKSMPGGGELWPAAPRLHSVAEWRRLGIGEASAAQAALDSVEKSPSVDALATLQSAGAIPGRSVSSEAQLASLLLRAQSAEWWRLPSIVGALVQLSGEAERLAAPTDPRVAVWSQPAIAAGDRARRAAMDALFIGDASAVARAKEHESEGVKHFESASAWQARARDAYELCDQALAELPYLAEWLAQPQTTRSDADRFDRLNQDTLLPLFDNVAELQAVLARGEGAVATPPGEAIPFATRAEEVRSQLDSLHEFMQTYVRERLAEKTPDGRTLRAYDALLETPVLPAAQRDEVWRARSKLSANLYRRYQQEPKPTPPAIESDQYHERVTSRWQTHPLSALWNLAHDANAATPSASAGPDWLGHLVRERLSKYAERARGVLQRGGDAAETVQLEPIVGAAVSLRRDGWARREFDLRAIAPLSSVRGDDPLVLVRRLDLQQVQLWNARRMLDDFYGPSAPGEAPFFATAAADAIDNARRLIGASSAVQREMDELSALVSARRDAASGAFSTSAADLLLVDPAEDVEVAVSVDRHVQAAAGLPEGEPAVWVRDRDGRLAGAGLAAADGGSETVSFALPAVELVDRGPALDALVTLRGNERGTTFLLRPPAGIAVDVSMHRYGSPRVVVQGRRRQSASFMLLLDCSYSMRDPIPGVESAGQAPEIPRMEAAKDALRRMMSQLALSGDARVGVRLFGHRVGWTTSSPSQVLPQPRYPRPAPPDLGPAEDVELVLPLGRFDSVVAGDVLELLDSVEPWGQSPLYLALRQALDDFTGENPDAERRIIVITDGANYQFNALRPTTRDDVLAAGAGRNTPIHIVGFGIPNDERAAAAEEFQSIADQTGGSYVNVVNATSLISSLEQLLGPTEYRVTSPDGKTFGPARVGTQVTIAPAPAEPTIYTVAAAAAEERIELSGGEAVELVLDRGGRELAVAPYERGATVSVPVVGGPSDQSSDQVFFMHQPLQMNERTAFAFSIQSAKRNFVPRPEELWIELAPLAADGRRMPESCQLYDANYEAETPVPVLAWQVQDWPAGSRQAAARLWYKNRATAPDLVVDNLGDPSHQRSTAHTVPGVDGVQCQLRVRLPQQSGEPTRISVVERHASTNPDLGALKVQLFPPPASVLHRWDHEHGLVVHLLAVDADVRDIDRYQLRFTSGEAVRSGAWHSQQPTMMDIGAAEDVIRLQPAQ